MLYECRLATTPTGLVIRPKAIAQVTLIDKGGGELLYLEDGDPHPLTICNDSTITIQRSGVIYTSVRDDDIFQEWSNEICNIIDAAIKDENADNSRYVLVSSADEMMALSNAYAPEHLIIQTKNYEQMAEQVVNAGSVFLGPYACESAGDYASGTNHTLPTHGYATAYNGVNLDSYCRKITFQHLTKEGIAHIGRAVELMAEAEELDAHKNAMTVRIKSIK
jgi:histidinol dehydrogenase